MSNYFLMLGTGWVVVFIFMSVLWYIGKIQSNYTVVDVGWTVSLVLLTLVYAILGEGYFLRKWIFFAIVLFWGARLGGYLLFTRILGGHGEDPRYAEFRKDYGESVDRKFYTNIFQFQGLLDVVLSVPFLVICANPSISFNPLEYAGIFLFIISLIGETISDRQLHSFKSKSENKNKTCDVGLWYYSRHPNYFFEWLVWVSWTLIAISAPYGIFSILSPAIMFFFLTKVTGVKLSEEHALRKRGDEYREYQRTTSPFVPWFKKK